MTDEFTIQCQSCGTYYNDLQDVCPYCGEPQPGPTEEIAPIIEEPPLEEPSAEAQQFLSPPADQFDEDSPDLYAADEQLPLDDNYFAAEDPFVEDDIFAVAGEPDQVDDYYLDDEQYHPDDEAWEEPLHAADTGYHLPDEAEPVDKQPVGRRFSFRHVLSGCLIIVVCALLFYGGLGILAVREGLQERAVIAQTESEAAYQRGQEHLANNAIELAIAEFEQAISLNPNFLEARQALREAQRIAQSQPTPTSETRTAAATELFEKANTQIAGQRWAEAIETLLQVRDLNPDYQSNNVSDLLYTAYYQTGLEQISPEQIGSALNAFEFALTERPNDPDASAEKTKAQLYFDGLDNADDTQQLVKIFSQLYELEPDYLDVADQLLKAQELLGDEYTDNKEWCLAEEHYRQADAIQSSTTLQAKAENSRARCQPSTTAATPQPTKAASTAATATPINTEPQATDTVTATVSSAPAAPGGGSLVFSAFNINEARWEIVSVPASGGSPTVLVTDATLPAVSPNGQLLLYHAELANAEGLHILNLTTGEDIRLTTVRDHTLPRWGGNNEEFIFVTQEAGTGRWLVHQGFADGKGDPVILGDGRTPDWSDDGQTLAYQGTDAEGNNPGIYLVPFGGGEPTRLTNHESDRSPVFSPDGSQIAYMSTRNGKWDIYTVSTAGSAPRQITQSAGNSGLPAWSPNGSQLAYVSDEDGSWAIYVANAQGGNPVKITEWDGARMSDWLMAQIWWTR